MQAQAHGCREVRLIVHAERPGWARARHARRHAARCRHQLPPDAGLARNERRQHLGRRLVQQRRQACVPLLLALWERAWPRQPGRRRRRRWRLLGRMRLLLLLLLRLLLLLVLLR